MDLRFDGEAREQDFARAIVWQHALNSQDKESNRVGLQLLAETGESQTAGVAAKVRVHFGCRLAAGDADTAGISDNDFAAANNVWPKAGQVLAAERHRNLRR